MPFVGILFGGAGATWGLISSRRKAIWAAAIAITGTLLNLAFAVGLSVKTVRSTSGADVRLAQQEMLKVVVALEDYHARENAYPPTLLVLRRRLTLRRLVPTIDISPTGFHFPHEYRYVLAPDGGSYDLVATGPDNKFGTADDIRPVLPDSIREHSGFRPPAAGVHP